MATEPLAVLIVGAGVAGSTLAGLLGRDGHRVVVVEKDQGVRSSGNPVDVRGPACEVLDSLDVLPRLRDLATSVTRVDFVDDVGRTAGTMSSQRRPERDFEISRSELSASLIDTARQFVELRFDDTVTSISQHGRRVDVTFARSPSGSFDLVVGADGLHSTTRRMVFGPEERFVRPFGMYVAGFPLENLTGVDGSVVLVHNAPGRSATIHPGAGQPVAAFIFRSSRAVDPRDARSMADLVAGTYRGGGWRDDELLELFAVADVPYVDQVSRVSVGSWTVGRVTLLGDAASCVSLFGEGSSSAVIGAGCLAGELAGGADVCGAVARYEQRHARQVRHGQRLAGLASHLLVPKTRRGITARNSVLRLAGVGRGSLRSTG
ncbi:MAG: FAD-dependent monooxygenase [Propionibacteriaceae bacterium]